MQKLINQNTVIKYILTGGLAFVIDYLLLLASYYVFSLPLWLATTLGYVGGLCVSFFVNRTWVFGDIGKKRKMTRQFVEYILLLLFNYLFTVSGIRLLDSMGIAPASSKIAITAMIVIWNYFIFNNIIFAKDKNHSR
ncbi:GtrA family protein [Candidatus Saccharibacteria bacterium]|jgi:putative flippase GtrA|nr:GtrA family protein [Candidatus Saccharibacteria bacterium]